MVIHRADLSVLAQVSDGEEWDWNLFFPLSSLFEAGGFRRPPGVIIAGSNKAIMAEK